MKVPVVKCACGYEHVLSRERSTPALQVICHSCFRSLMWKDGVPVAIRAVLESGAGCTGSEVTRLEVLRMTELGD